MKEQHSTEPTRPLRVSEVGSWDATCDVVVVGFGGAGACAALEAHDAGAEVMLLDLASRSGGSTRLSSAELYLGGSGGTPVQRACGFTDSTEAMVRYLTMSAGPQADDAKIRRYCEGAVEHFGWLQAQGVPFKESFSDERAMLCMTDDCLLYTGSEKAWPFRNEAKPCPRGHNLQVEGDKGGPLLMDTLTARVQERAIDVRLETRALTLVCDDKRERVLGLVMREAMREVTVRARRGVILCAGGFVMNDEMLRKYAPGLLRASVKAGNPGDTGSGILMGLGMGAAAINMHEGFVSLPFYPPGELTEGIFVNARGQRFINEDCYHGRVGAHALQQLGDRIYLVFSVTDAFRPPTYLNADICATGETIEELARELGTPEGRLEETVSYYNRHAAEGRDPLYHKAPRFLRPLAGPFAALDCTPGRGVMIPHFTLGGLDTLPDGEVLTPAGAIIPGLYAAGRTACGIPRRGEGYASGLSIGDATFFGRLAGRSAARRADTEQ